MMGYANLAPSEVYAEAYHRAHRPEVRDQLAEHYYCARAAERNQAFLVQAKVVPEPEDTLTPVIQAAVTRFQGPAPTLRWNQRLARRLLRLSRWFELAW